jgi:hypothetical protein
MMRSRSGSSKAASLTEGAPTALGEFQGSPRVGQMAAEPPKPVAAIAAVH